MKYLKQVLNYCVSIFTAVTVILTVLCFLKLTPDTSLTESVFQILLMALITGGFITARNALITGRPVFGFVVGVLGCTILVFFAGSFGGWITLTWESLGVVFGVTLLVYLMVQLFSALQSRKDAEELNAQLSHLKKRKR